MIPLSIRFERSGGTELNHHPSNVVVASAEAVLEFAYVYECEQHGVNLRLPGEEFACHDASCRPPRSGGTGGSKSKGGAGGRFRA